MWEDADRVSRTKDVGVITVRLTRVQSITPWTYTALSSGSRCIYLMLSGTLATQPLDGPLPPLATMNAHKHAVKTKTRHASALWSTLYTTLPQAARLLRNLSVVLFLSASSFSVETGTIARIDETREDRAPLVNARGLSRVEGDSRGDIHLLALDCASIQGPMAA